MRKTGVLLAAVALVLGSTSAASAVVSTDPDPAAATFNGNVSGIAYAGDTVYIVGSFTEATDARGTVTRSRAAAISASTGQLLPWHPNANGTVFDVVVLPDGNVAIGGSFGKVKGMARKNVAIVDPAKAAPTPFQAEFDGRVRALESSPDGRLYVGGAFTIVNGEARRGFAAFDAGTLSSWAPQASGDRYSVLALESTNGVVYAGGKFTSINGVSGSGYLAALDPATGTVTAWNPPVNYVVNDIDADASTVYAAADGPGGHLRAQAVSDGATRWDLTTDGGVQAVHVSQDGVYFGGHFDNACLTPRTGSKGVCLDGEVSRRKLGLADVRGNLQPWAPIANSSLGVHSMESNGTKLGVGGTFTHINYKPRGGFAQFS